MQKANSTQRKEYNSHSVPTPTPPPHLFSSETAFSLTFQYRPKGDQGLFSPDSITVRLLGPGHLDRYRSFYSNEPIALERSYV